MVTKMEAININNVNRKTTDTKAKQTSKPKTFKTLNGKYISSRTQTLLQKTREKKSNNDLIQSNKKISHMQTEENKSSSQISNQEITNTRLVNSNGNKILSNSYSHIQQKALFDKVDISNIDQNPRTVTNRYYFRRHRNLNIKEDYIDIDRLPLLKSSETLSPSKKLHTEDNIKEKIDIDAQKNASHTSFENKKLNCKTNTCENELIDNPNSQLKSLRKRQRTRSKFIEVDIETDHNSVEYQLEEQFSEIVGQEQIKNQLRDFISETRVRLARERIGHSFEKLDSDHKQNSLFLPSSSSSKQEAKVKKTRSSQSKSSAANISLSSDDLQNQQLYHMVFRGPSGTGKTLLAKLVARVLHRLGVVQNDKVEIVSNPLVQKGLHCGETVPKVNKSVAQAEGGVLFVDEAYFLLQANDKFGEEILGTLMCHMLPPKCVFIFAGYSEPMERFMTANAGLKSRCPFIFNFESYSIDELLLIFRVICQREKEICDHISNTVLRGMISKVPLAIRTQYNGRMIERQIGFAKQARNRRICKQCPTAEQLEALGRNLYHLEYEDLVNGMNQFKETSKPIPLKNKKKKRRRYSNNINNKSRSFNFSNHSYSNLNQVDQNDFTYDQDENFSSCSSFGGESEVPCYDAGACA